MEFYVIILSMDSDIETFDDSDKGFQDVIVMNTIYKNKSPCETNLDAMITAMVPDKTKIKKYGAGIEEADDRFHFIEDLVEVVAQKKTNTTVERQRRNYMKEKEL